MIHEFIQILNQAKRNRNKGVRCLLATVVDLDGSSYRKPGVRMLLDENGTKTGAVSGGCVENMVLFRSQSVFNTGIPKVITYDGRYKLGCEGVLYILLEPFFVTDNFYNDFKECLKSRKPLNITTYYSREDESTGRYGSVVSFVNGKRHTFRERANPDFLQGPDVFRQTLKSRFKLLIIGGEHDAVKLCAMASLLGWEVHVVTSVKDPKSKEDFPGAAVVTANAPETMLLKDLDNRTAVVLMTHSYVLDLKYLIKLQKATCCYVGVLGSVKRRERLQNEIFEYDPMVCEDFIFNIHSPAGLNIGAETPEEIALSILSEILSVTRVKEPFSLKLINTTIHS